MKEDELNEIFRNFNPEMSSGSNFMSRLEGRLDAVEMVKQRNAQTIRNTRIAAILAAVAGFIAGMLTMLFMPWITATAQAMLEAVQIHTVLRLSATESLPIFGWLATGFMALLTALTTYSLALPLLHSRSLRTRNISWH